MLKEAKGPDPQTRPIKDYQGLIRPIRVYVDLVEAHSRIASVHSGYRSL